MGTCPCLCCDSYPGHQTEENALPPLWLRDKLCDRLLPIFAMTSVFPFLTLSVYPTLLCTRTRHNRGRATKHMVFKKVSFILPVQEMQSVCSRHCAVTVEGVQVGTTLRLLCQGTGHLQGDSMWAQASVECCWSSRCSGCWARVEP